MDSLLPWLFPYLTQSELRQMTLVSRGWKDAVDAHFIWKALFSSVCSAAREHFGRLTPQIRVRTLHKPKAVLRTRPQLIAVEVEAKQWIVIPGDLMVKLKFTTINKVGLLKRDPEFMQAAARLMSGWTANLNSLVGALLRESDAGTLIEEASYWRDSERVLAQALDELTDINVAKLDSILTGYKEHKHFKGSVAKVKKNFKKAKAYNQFYKNTSAQLEKLELSSLPQCFASLLATTKLMGVKEFSDTSKIGLLQRVFEFVVVIICKEITLNQCFIRKTEPRLEGIVEGLEVLLGSELFLTEIERPRTAMTAVSETDTRASSRSCLASDSSGLIQRASYIIRVARDLQVMLHDYSCILHSLSPTVKQELIRIYEQTPPDFDIWDKQNCLKWELLRKNFASRSRPLAEAVIEDTGNDEANDVSWSIS